MCTCICMLFLLGIQEKSVAQLEHPESLVDEDNTTDDQESDEIQSDTEIVGNQVELIDTSEKVIHNDIYLEDNRMTVQPKMTPIFNSGENTIGLKLNICVYTGI